MAYSRVGKHLYFSSCAMTSLEADRPTLAKILLAGR